MDGTLTGGACTKCSSAKKKCSFVPAREDERVAKKVKAGHVAQMLDDSKKGDKIDGAGRDKAAMPVAKPQFAPPPAFLPRSVDMILVGAMSGQRSLRVEKQVRTGEALRSTATAERDLAPAAAFSPGPSSSSSAPIVQHGLALEPLPIIKLPTPPWLPTHNINVPGPPDSAGSGLQKDRDPGRGSGLAMNLDATEENMGIERTVDILLQASASTAIQAQELSVSMNKALEPAAQKLAQQSMPTELVGRKPEDMGHIGDHATEDEDISRRKLSWEKEEDTNGGKEEEEEGEMDWRNFSQGLEDDLSVLSQDEQEVFRLRMDLEENVRRGNEQRHMDGIGIEQDMHTGPSANAQSNTFGSDFPSSSPKRPLPACGDTSRDTARNDPAQQLAEEDDPMLGSSNSSLEMGQRNSSTKKLDSGMVAQGTAVPTTSVGYEGSTSAGSSSAITENARPGSDIQADETACSAEAIIRALAEKIIEKLEMVANDDLRWESAIANGADEITFWASNGERNPKSAAKAATLRVDKSRTTLETMMAHIFHALMTSPGTHQRELWYDIAGLSTDLLIELGKRSAAD